MIREWRAAWADGAGQQSLPFGFAQIGPRDCVPCADHQGPNGTFYGGIRWSQTAFQYVVPNALMPNAFMAVTADLAEGYSPVLGLGAGCVHFGDKQDVGRRLALGVRKAVYGHDVVASGPMVVSADVVNGEALRLRFDGPIEVRNASGFELSKNGADYAAATITTHDADSVTLAIPAAAASAAAVVSLRYILHDTPCINQTCAIYGPTGLPSPPLVANLPGHHGADPVGWNVTAMN